MRDINALKDIVKNLMAQAQSVIGTPEYEVYMTKAANIMAKHQIEVSLDDTNVKSQKMGDWRVSFSNPYAKSKKRLFSAIANTYNCKTVILADDVLHVFGHESDYEAADFMFDMLWLNGQRELGVAYDDMPPWDNKRSFTTSFFYNYTATIRRRLQFASRVVVEDSAPGAALVLVDRKEAAERAMNNRYDNLKYVTSSVSTNSDSGLRAGRDAGERADLGNKSRLHFHNSNKELE